MIAKSMGISESDLESKLKGGESNTPKETTVNHNHTYTIKSDGTVVDAMTREVTKSPSLLNDFSQSIIPDPMEYTSNTLPSKFY
jgi:hypothetical protein